MKKKTSKTVPKRQAPRQTGTQVRARAQQTKPPARPKKAAPVEAPVVEAVLAPVPAVEAAADDVIVLETPEPRFASRVLPAEADRPFPVSRRAIFFDVENASRPEHIARVIDHLEVDRAGRRIDFVAVGNWRVIGHDTARLLARHGAHLIHSAPSVGVRDWSDLRIAVGAGVWLAGARPGDVIDIVTSDRAFDAVGDVAASLGIAFRRLSHQGLTGSTETRAPAREAPTDSRSRYRGRSRRRGSSGWRDRVAPSTAAPAPPREVVPVAVAAPPPGPTPEPPPAEPSSHTAPHDEIIAVVHDLMQRSTGRTVTLDTLANALKARGFSRPPGSPRLITRLRRIKEIALSRTGVITLVGNQQTAASPEEPVAVEPVETPVAGPLDVEALDVEALAVDSRSEPGNEALLDLEEGPGPGNEKVPGTSPSGRSQEDPRRRRSRRGGRGYRPRREPARAV